MKHVLTVLLAFFALVSTASAQLSGLTEKDVYHRCRSQFVESHVVGPTVVETYSIATPIRFKLMRELWTKENGSPVIDNVGLQFDASHGMRLMGNNEGWGEKLLTEALPCLNQNPDAKQETPKQSSAVADQLSALRKADAEMWTERAAKAGFSVKFTPCRNGAALCGEFQGEDALPYIQKIYGDTESSRELAQKGYSALLLRNTPKDQKNQQYFGMKPTPQGWKPLSEVQKQ